MPREIKTTLALDGEKKFKDGINSVNNEIRMMSSELGALTSGYDKNGASVKQLSAETANLAKQVDLQRAKTEALKGAVGDSQDAYDKAVKKAAEMSEQYGENSKEAQLAAQAVAKAEKSLVNYTIQANNAEKSLNKMNDAYKTAEKAKFEKMTEGLKKVADNAAKAAKEMAKISGAALEKGLSGMAKGLAAYTTAVTGAGTAAFGFAAKAGLAADDLNTLSTQTGLSTAQLQKFRYATDLIDVPLETLTGSMAKLTKNMASAQDGTGATAEAFAALGVSVTNSDGSLRSNQEVFNEAITSLGTIENATQRDALAMQIFGKSAQDLNPLILGGAESLKLLGDSAGTAGLILSQDALNSLNGFNDSLDILKANAGAAGNVIAGNFAGEFKGLTDTVGSAIPKLTEGFGELYRTGDNKKLENGFVTMVTGIMTKLSDMTPQIIATFNGILLAVAVALSAGAPTLFGEILPQMITGFTELVSGLVAQVPALLPVLIDGAFTLFLGLPSGLDSVVKQLMPMLPDIITKLCDALIANLPSIIETGFNILIGLALGIADAVPQLLVQVVGLIPVLVSAILDNLPKILEAGVQIIVALAKGLPEGITAVIEAIPLIIDALISCILETDWLDIGWQIIKGIGEGLWDGAKALVSGIGDIGSQIVNGFKDFFDIHSPSRKFRDEVGKYLALGIGVGFTEEMDAVADKMAKSVPTEFNVVANSRAVPVPADDINLKFPRNPQGGSAGAGGDTYYVNIDPKSVKEFNDIVNICENARQRQRA